MLLHFVYLFPLVCMDWRVLYMALNLKGDKVSMLTHTYPHKPLKKIEVTICSRQADSPLYVYVWPDVWSDDLQV